MRTLLVALVTLALTPAAAQAGGGSKPNSTIVVRNNSADTLGVAVDASSALQARLNGAGVTSTGQFVSLGGRIVGPRGTISIPVRAGAHTVTAAYIGANAVTVNDTTNANVSTSKGRTATINVSGSVGVNPTITVP